MKTRNITRRGFLATAAIVGVAGADDGWVELFDGQSLDGWTPSENKDSWKVVDGALATTGRRSHLFYSGPVNGGDFKNFELEVEVLTEPLCNSGVYFHTTYQEEGFPRKGFEVQVNNTATGERKYLERKKTGSLYGVRNVYKAFASDGKWFTLRAVVRGKNIQTWLNGVQLVDYTEADPPLMAAGNARGRYLDHGTFALQGHDPGSKVRYRRVRVRPLPDDTPSPEGAVAAVGPVAQEILNLSAKNFPVVDYHVHLKSGLTLEQALAKSRHDGIQYGIAVNCGKGFPVQDDASALAFLEGMKGQPVFIAMQAEGREWTQMFSRKAVSQFDYVFTDSMTWTDNHGKRMRLWIPREVGEITDAEAFMDTLVDRAVGIFNNEPIDIYVNPTFLPAVIAKDYDRLWTPQRMKRMVDAIHTNGIAVEINNRYKLPSLEFLRAAKEAGCKFSFGTNNGGPDDLGRCEYAIEMTKKLGLTWRDIFVPGAWGPRGIERKPEALAS